MDIRSIEEKINDLPDDLKQEVLDFIDFLLIKKSRKSDSAPFDFNWEGAISEYKKAYSSVSLQHQAKDWR